MFDHLKNIIPHEFIPHGLCFNWSQWLITLHAISDSIIAFSYFAIPLISYSFLKKQIKDSEFRKIWILFALFIILCGITHLFEIINIWKPLYWETGIAKLITAMVSALTFINFYPFLLKIVDRPTIDQYFYIENQLNKLTVEKNKILTEYQRLINITNHSDGMVVILSQSFNIEYANNSFLNSLEYSMEEIRNKSLHDLSAGLISIHDSLKLNKCLLDGERWNGEVVNYTKSGAMKQCIATIIPIKKIKEKIFNYVVVFHEIENFK
jgi:PAS domain S-box-containing protein